MIYCGFVLVVFPDSFVLYSNIDSLYDVINIVVSDEDGIGCTKSHLQNG